MFTVAIIGPDGAGKTTIGRQLEHQLPLPVKYVYMGVSADASNHMLPTTRLLRAVKRACGGRPDTHGPRDHKSTARSAGLVRRAAGEIKSALSLVNRLAEEWYRQALVWRYLRRQCIVLLDRHYFPDYYAYDIAADGQYRPLARRIHGFLLKHMYPRPDLFIYLDAPAEVLLARKGEGTLELLERRRSDYLQIGDVVDHFEIVDAARPQAQVVSDVRGRICDFYQAKFRSNTAVKSAAAAAR